METNWDACFEDCIYLETLSLVSQLLDRPRWRKTFPLGEKLFFGPALEKLMVVRGKPPAYKKNPSQLLLSSATTPKLNAICKGIHYSLLYLLLQTQLSIGPLVSHTGLSSSPLTDL